MLQVLKDRGVNPKRPNDPDGAPVQPVSRHCDRAGTRIGREMLKRAGEAGSHNVFRRQQRQKTKKADANPRQEPKRCSEEARAHPHRLSGLGGFGKSGPRVLDRLTRMLDAATRVDSASLGYPPYDIEKTGDDVYRLTMAVAGVSPDELDVTVQENVQLAYFAAKVRTLAAEAGMPNLD